MSKFLKIVSIIFLLANKICLAQTDTFNIMSYNVLNYGDNCQNPPSLMHPLLKNVVQFAKPDLLALVKLQSIKINASDFYDIGPIGFADSIEKYALNAALPNTFAHCPFTNYIQSTTIDVLFYNQHKFGYRGIKTLCTNTEDFNLFTLFIQDTMLARVHDTTFLYVVLCHTQSGNSTTIRDEQDSTILHNLVATFNHLPNVIYMGDFNTSTTTETGYNLLTHQTDSTKNFYDPPFSLDHNLSYPLNFGNNPSACAKFLTTSTRLSASIPNSCGTSGGGKNWYDHILLSNWIKNNTFNISYLPHSYYTIGNDGHRVGISVNDSSTIKNTSAPSIVVNSMFQFSNKYPIAAKLVYQYKNAMPATGIANVGNSESNNLDEVEVYPNPASQSFVISNLASVNTIMITNIMGQIVKTINNPSTNDLRLSANYLPNGIYFITINNATHRRTLKLVIAGGNK